MNDSKLGVDVVTRPMHTDDIDSVGAIEFQAFTSPWKAETFLGLINRDGAEAVSYTHLTLPTTPYV